MVKHTSVEKLLLVQDVDSQIIFLEEAKRVRPQELSEDRQRVVRAEEGVEGVHRKIKALRMDVDRRELDVKKFDEEIAKLTVALNQTRSNSEYGVVRDQVERQKEKRGETEEDVLEILMELDRVQAVKAEEEKRLESTKGSFGRKEAQMNELLESLESQLRELRERREGLIDGVDPEHLGLYERVLNRRRNFAIARVEGQICQGCHMRLTPQNVNLLMQAMFVQCSNCTRLLYLDDD